MGALHVVGEDLESRPGVDLGVVGEQQVLVGLAGIRTGRVRPHDDASVEHPMPAFVHDSLVELAAGAPGRGVLDQNRIVVVLVASWQVQAVDAGLRPFALEAHAHLVAGDLRPQCHRARREPAAGALADVEQREVERGVGLVLDLVVLDPCSLVEDHLGHGVGAGDAARGPGVGLDDCHPASRTGQDQ